jgi:hypothetical protein
MDELLEGLMKYRVQHYTCPIGGANSRAQTGERESVGIEQIHGRKYLSSICYQLWDDRRSVGRGKIWAVVA